LEHKTGIDLTVSSTLKKPSKNYTCFISRRFGYSLHNFWPCICFQQFWRGWLSWGGVWCLLRHSIVSYCVTKPYGFELLTFPSVALFFDW